MGLLIVHDGAGLGVLMCCKRLLMFFCCEVDATE